jgi:hypothetical protein
MWVKEFNFPHQVTHSGTFGLWNGDSFVYKEVNKGYLSSLKLMLRYGYDLYAMRGVVQSAIKKFDVIYDAQEKGIAFEDSKSLWQYSGLYEYTQRTFKDVMSECIPTTSMLLKELLYACNKVNYNQDNDINGLAGLGIHCNIL